MTSISERIWAHDASLWTDSGEDRWLGWLDVVTRVEPHVGELNSFAESATRDLMGHAAGPQEGIRR